MEIYRNYDPEILNAVINHPQVRPTVGGDGYLDSAALLSNKWNICLLTEGGGGLFIHIDRGYYEGHSFWLPEFRGTHAIRASKEIFRISKRYGVDVIYGETPVELRACRYYNRKIGMKHVQFLPATKSHGEMELTVLRN